ncbi:MAG: hypothetical protein QW728_07600 [Thermoplasmata archaeon]
MMIAAVIGFFYYQQSTFEEEEFRNMVQVVANKINEVSRSPCNTTMWVTFNENLDNEKGNVYISGMFRNNQYEINITHNKVFFRQSTLVVSSDIHYDIHTFNPDETGSFSGPEYYIKRSELERLDTTDATSHLEFMSGGKMSDGRYGDIKIERKLIVVSGEKDLHTFVYLQPQKKD